MRVMCISELKANLSTMRYQESLIKVGETYHVLDEFEQNRRKYYNLIEFGYDYGFTIDAFIPISDDDVEQVSEVEEHELATA